MTQCFLHRAVFDMIGMSDSALRRSDQRDTHKFHDLHTMEFLELKW
jgi:hypothetical protein